MLCEICRISESNGVLSKVPNSDTTYILLYTCNACHKRYSRTFSRSKSATPTPIVKKCTSCEVRLPERWLGCECFKCMIINELNNDVKPGKIKILEPERVDVKCSLCNSWFHGFISEYNRIGWVKRDKGPVCFECSTLRYLYCHHCSRSYEYSLKTMGREFAMKIAGFKVIGNFSYCKSCYDKINIKRKFTAAGLSKLYDEQVYQKQTYRRPQPFMEEDFTAIISEDADEDYAVFYDYRDPRGRLFSTSRRDYIRIEKGIA